MINLINADCMEVMKDFKDNEFDLAIVDPPYGININHNMGRRKGQKPSKHKKVVWDNKIPSKLYFIELLRISKNQIIWGGNYFANLLPNSPCWLMWDKGFSEEVTFAQYEMAWTSFFSSAKKYDKTPNQLDKIHPTQKPIKLYEWILENYAKEGDKILDTHLGSGSIAIACHYAGHDLTGIEIDKEYFDSAKYRIDLMTKQKTLF